MTQRHDAKFSPSVLAKIKGIVNDPERPIPGMLFDPFAGVGTGSLLRPDWAGIELEPEYAAENDKVEVGDALDPEIYPEGIGCIVTSPTYGNRLAGNYLGGKCKTCGGIGVQASARNPKCPGCDGDGTDRKSRKGYAISLGRELTDGNTALYTFGEKYKTMHAQWLRVIADVIDVTGEGIPGLILNMSDHYKSTIISKKSYQEYVHVCRWWLVAANLAGWKYLESHSVLTQRSKEGANRDARVPYEQVFLFAL